MKKRLLGLAAATAFAIASIGAPALAEDTRCYGAFLSTAAQGENGDLNLVESARAGTLPDAIMALLIETACPN